MKSARISMAAAVVLLLALPTVGCDEDPVDSDAATSDGGVEAPPDASEGDSWLQDQLDDLSDRNAELGAELAGLRDGLADAAAAIDDLDEVVAEHDDRIKALEPCEGEACASDAIERFVSYLSPIFAAACDDVFNCCSEAQIAEWYNFTTSEECVAVFSDVVSRGHDVYLPGPSVMWELPTSIEVFAKGGIALADSSAVDACAEAIRDDACRSSAEVDYCDEEAWREAQADPCALTRLFEGTRHVGEACGQFEGQCLEGLTCRFTHTIPRDAYDTSFANTGFCAPQAREGDRCTGDATCERQDAYPDRSGEALFCNPHTSRCEPVRQLDEPCEIEERGPYEDAWLQDFYPVECAQRLSCHPERQVCVRACSEGAWCDTYMGSCGDDLICASGTWGDREEGGTCSAPIATGMPCQQPDECESGRCGFDVVDARNECLAPPSAPGGACTLEEPGVGQSDSGCSSGWCAADGACAALCSVDVPCEEGRICLELLDGFRCEVPIANGDACAGTFFGTLDASCASGFCNGESCEAKAELGGACPSERDEQCLDAQYCAEGTCTDRAELGESCELDAACPRGAYCAAAGPSANTCVTYVLVAATCDESTDVRCAPDLDCTPFGDVSQCHAPGAFPDGASCLYDALCGSGWCELGTCRPALGEGDACEDTVEGSHCAAGLTCSGGVCSASSAMCTLYDRY